MNVKRAAWMVACGALLWPSIAAGQASRLGSTVALPKLPAPVIRYPDLSHDTAHNVYLVVTGGAAIQGVYLSASGTLVAGPFRINETSAYAQTPRVHYSASAQEFLVSWHEQTAAGPNVVKTRALKYGVGFVGQEQVISAPGTFWEQGADITSGDSEFLVTWPTTSANIYARRIGFDGVPLGSPILVSALAEYERDPSAGYNSASNEYLVAWAGYSDAAKYGFVSVRRLKPGTDTPVAAGVMIQKTGATYLPAVAVNRANDRYLVSWYQSGGSRAVYGTILDASGATIAAPYALNTRFAFYDSNDLDYNPVSGTFFGVGHSDTVEDSGFEISGGGAPSAPFYLTAAGGTGNFNPRVTTSGTAARWMAVTSTSFSYVSAQLVQTASTNGGSGGPPAAPPPPPPPPPACSVSISPAWFAVSAAGGFGNLTVSTGGTTCAWTARSNVPWISVSPGSGTTGTTVQWVVQPNTSAVRRGGIVTVNGMAFSISQSPAGPARLLDFDGNGTGDVFLYKPSTGAWSRELNVGGLIEDLKGTWGTNWTIFPAEFNADGKADLFLYNFSTGAWYKVITIDGFFYYIGGQWSAGWIPLVADFTGDGISDVFLYSQATGRWFLCITQPGSTDFIYRTGTWSPGWNVYLAKFNLDGRADLFLYNPSTVASNPNGGLWYRVLTQPDGSFSYVAGDARWSAGWTVIPADFSGDGVSEMFLYKAGTGQWFVVRFAGTSATYENGSWAAGWTIKRGYFNADSMEDLFLYNSSTGAWFMALRQASGGFAYAQGQWATGWVVNVTDSNYDGISDLVLYRSSDGAYARATVSGPGQFVYDYGNVGTGWTVLATSPIWP